MSHRQIMEALSGLLLAMFVAAQLLHAAQKSLPDQTYSPNRSSNTGRGHRRHADKLADRCARSSRGSGRSA